MAKAKKKVVKKKAVKKRAAAPRVAKVETKVDAALVARTLEKVREVERVRGRALREVGAVVLRDYFGGDLEMARSNQASKPRSYARLVELAAEETTWDAIDFRDAVIAEVTARSLPAAIAGRVEATYLVRLASVDDPAVRVEIATRIAQDEVRGQDAKDLIAKHAGETRRGGQVRMAGPARVIGAVERALERAREAGDLTRREVGKMEEEARREVAGRIRAAVEELRDLAGVVDPG